MVFVLELSVDPADRLLFLTGTPPEDGAILEMCSDSAREIVLVESQAGSRSVWVQLSVAVLVSRRGAACWFMAPSGLSAVMTCAGGGEWKRRQTQPQEETPDLPPRAAQTRVGGY